MFPVITAIVFICAEELGRLLKMHKLLSSRGAVGPGGKYGPSLRFDSSPEATSNAACLSIGGKKNKKKAAVVATVPF